MHGYDIEKNKNKKKMLMFLSGESGAPLFGKEVIVWNRKFTNAERKNLQRQTNNSSLC
jgi:hypothetical protein